MFVALPSPALLVGLTLALSVGNAPAQTPPAERTLSLPREAAAYGRLQHAALPLGPREIVLTFDDGPRPESTPRVLAALAAEGVHASFFMVGESMARHPELARRVRAEGHSVALHSWSHPNLSELSVEAQHADLKQVQAVFERTFGEPAAAYRFPYLAETPAMRATLAAQRITVMSADAGAEDWVQGQSPQQLADRLHADLEKAGGGIVLLHDVQDQTAEALPHILRTLRARGWRFVHLQWP